MAHQQMRGNLGSTVFPFASSLFGRSIIVPQFDQNFDRSVNSPADQDKDKGIPQAMYMHNCIPTAQGFQATAFDIVAAAMAPAQNDFDKIFPLQAPNLARFLFSPAVGKNYIYDATVGAWMSRNPIAPGVLPSNVIVTTAFIHGQSYMWYANFGGFTYNTATKAMDPVVLAGLVAADVNGLCAANGYMIACSDTDVVWSNSTVETDFVPSLVTGAGGGSVAEAKGRIVACLPIAGGFIVYCEQNAVAAKYSGNARFPFVFKEIPGSGGITTPESVSWQANLSEHYAYTSAGLQKLDLTLATVLFPECTDFLANKIFEDFDEITRVLTTTYLGTQLTIRITSCGDRYVIISYGVATTDFTHALVYDIALKRWGKFKITHRDCFQWNGPNLYGIVLYGALPPLTYGALGDTTYGEFNTIVSNVVGVKKNIGFLQADGTVKVVNFDLEQSNADGVLIIGKFQFQRNRFLIHQFTDVENLKNGNTFNFFILPTNDGKNFLPAVDPVLVSSNPLSKRYGKMITAQNLAFGYMGAFNLTTYIHDFMLGGEW